MIVSHSKKFVFLHNPKAGGSSLRRVFLQYAKDDRFRYHGFVNGRLYPLSHLPGTLAMRVLQSETPNFSRDYKIVMLYRDPLARFISAASEFELKYRDWYQKFNLPVKEFLMQMLTPESLQLPHFSWFQLQKEFWPSFTYLPNTRLVSVEDLAIPGTDHWASLLDFLELPFQPLPVENSGIERPGRLSADDPEVRSRVAMLYADDYDWFNSLSYYNSPDSIKYLRPVETTLQTDSYLWGLHSVKRSQARLTRTLLPPLNKELQAALDTPLLTWNV